METVPGKMTGPLFEITGSTLAPTVKVSWTKQAGRYELLWAPGSEELALIYEGTATEYMASDVFLNTKYRFAVRVKNLCGSSPLSDESVLEIKGGIPDKASPVKVQVMMDSCVVKFETQP